MDFIGSYFQAVVYSKQREFVQHFVFISFTFSTQYTLDVSFDASFSLDADALMYLFCSPCRAPLPSTSENYNIDDLDSGDSTDEEDAPRKTIPSWAQGRSLCQALCMSPHDECL